MTWDTENYYSMDRDDEEFDQPNPVDYVYGNPPTDFAAKWADESFSFYSFDQFKTVKSA